MLLSALFHLTLLVTPPVVTTTQLHSPLLWLGKIPLQHWKEEVTREGTLAERVCLRRAAPVYQGLPRNLSSPTLHGNAVLLAQRLDNTYVLHHNHIKENGVRKRTHTVGGTRSPAFSGWAPKKAGNSARGRTQRQERGEGLSEASSFDPC